jgi:hypothetical protein
MGNTTSNNEIKSSTSSREAALVEAVNLIDVLERKYEFDSKKLDIMKREASDLGKIYQHAKSKPKMAELNAKLLQIKRGDTALQQVSTTQRI